MTPVEKLLRDLIVTLERLQIPYAMIGGWAVRAYGTPRPTYDVDVTILLDRAKLHTLFSAIDEIGYDIDEAYQREWTDDVAGMPLVKAKTFVDGRALVADIFLAKTPFQLCMMNRTLRLPVDGFDACVVSPEDLVLLKLVASRHRDLGDVQDILFIQGKLDERYMRKWAAELGVLEKLESALEEAQPEVD
jgi:predicted nucleotidyltransferase